MYTFTVANLPGGLTITGEVDGPKEVFQHVHFWQSLPHVCPIDGTATVLRFKQPGDFEYYSLASTGTPTYEYKLGIHNTKDKTLFAKGQWTLWDAEKKEEVVVWENGQFLNGHKPKPQAQRADPTPRNNGKQRREMPPEVQFQTPPQDEQKVGRWTESAAKAVLNSGDTYNFPGKDDAQDFAVAAGAWTREEVEAQYETAKSQLKPKSAGEMWKGWLDAVAGKLMDTETWA